MTEDLSDVSTSQGTPGLSKAGRGMQQILL